MWLSSSARFGRNTGVAGWLLFARNMGVAGWLAAFCQEYEHADCQCCWFTRTVSAVGLQMRITRQYL